MPENIITHAPPIAITFIIYVNGSKVSFGATGTSSDRTWQTNWDYFGDYWAPSKVPYTLTDTNVIWENNSILVYNDIDVLPTDSMIHEGNYTTRKIDQKILTTNNKILKDKSGKTLII